MVSDKFIEGFIKPYPISAISLQPRTTVQKVLNVVTRGKFGNGKGGKRKTKQRKSRKCKKSRKAT
jgi:hypothetical protein